MYTIIGGDGKEYGPVTAEQVRAWIAGGRANLQTKVKLVGTEEWKTIEEFPEITSGAATTGFATTPAVSVYNEAAKLDIISCYERSWALLKANFWPLVGVTVLMSIIYSVLGYSNHKGVIVVPPLLGGVLGGGFYYYFLLKVRGLPTTLGDLFAGFTRAFVTLLVAGILIAVFVAVGCICLLLPGIYLAVAYSFTKLLAVDKGLGFWEAMETSRRIITRQWWRILGLLLLSIPFLLLGCAALLVGVFVAIPLITGAVVYAYEDLCNPGK
jgi:hypothetical protein